MVLVAEGETSLAFFDNRDVAQGLAFSGSFGATALKRIVQLFQFREKGVNTGGGEARLRQDWFNLHCGELQRQTALPRQYQGFAGCVHGVQVVAGIRLGVALSLGLAYQGGKALRPVIVIKDEAQGSR